MTANVDYTYLNLGLPFNKANIESMIRAVRIKLGVKDKIMRNYNPEAKVENAVEKKESLIDTSAENLEKLNLKLDAMINQKKVPYVQKRVVLFTKTLVEKIEKVSSKWFIREDKKETSNKEVNVGVKDMAIPNNWENVESNELENNLQNGVQTGIAKSGATPVTLDTNSSESTEIELTKAATMPIEEKQAETVPAEPVTIENNIEPTLPAETVVKEKPSSFDFALPSFDFGKKEGQTATVESELPALAEKSNIPSFDFNSNMKTPNVEIPITTESTTEEPDKQNVSMSIEDKIASLLKSQDKTPEVEEKHEKIKVPSQADVLASVQRFKNVSKDKDAEIAALRKRNDDLNATNSGYEAVIRNITTKYNTAIRSNGEISSKYEQLKEASKAQIAALEEELKKSQQARMAENEKSKQTIADLKSSHTEEMEELNRINGQRIQKIRDEKDKQLKEAYSSILEVLSPSEETYKKAA